MIRFGSYQFDRQTGELRRAGLRVPLQAQPARLLTLLLERPGETVTRKEIRALLWADRHVEADLGVAYCIRHLRAALGDRALEPAFIETIRGQGYRFIGTIDHGEPTVLARPSRPAGVWRWRFRSLGRLMAVAGSGAIAAVLFMSRVHPGAAGLETVTLAMLPFENLTSNVSCEWAAQRLATSLGTALSTADPTRLRVVTAGAAENRNEPTTGISDPRAVQPTFLFTGAISVIGGRHRFTMRVIRSATGAVVWNYSVDSGTAMGQPPSIAKDVMRALHRAELMATS